MITPTIACSLPLVASTSCQIEETLSKLGVAPADEEHKAPSGSSYTLPAILDLEGIPGTVQPSEEMFKHDTPLPLTGRCVMRSDSIASYLDTHFPARPLIRGSNDSQRAQYALIDMVTNVLLPPLSPILAPEVVKHLPPRGAAWYRAHREHKFGCSLEALAAVDDVELERRWSLVTRAFGAVAVFVHERGDVLFTAEVKDGCVRGFEPTYAALTVAALLACIDRVGPSGALERIRNMHEGLWDKLWLACEPYMG